MAATRQRKYLARPDRCNAAAARLALAMVLSSSDA
jgi:hypothetical protein